MKKNEQTITNATVNKITDSVITTINKRLKPKKYPLKPLMLPFIIKDTIQILSFLFDKTEIEIVSDVINYARTNNLNLTEEFYAIENDKMYTNALLQIQANKNDVKWLNRTKRESIYLYSNFMYFFDEYYQNCVNIPNQKLIQLILDSKYLHRSVK